MTTVLFQNRKQIYADIKRYILDPAYDGKKVSIVTPDSESAAKYLMNAVLNDWREADTLKGNEIPDMVNELSEFMQLPIYIGETEKENCDVVLTFGWTDGDGKPFFVIGKSCVESDVCDENLRFKAGDYVHLAGGGVIICAGYYDGDYLCHACLNGNDELVIADPSNCRPLVAMKREGDRLCTEEEMMRINGELMKAGKIFDITQKKVVDSVFKKNPGLFEKFKKDWEKYRSNDNDNDNDDEGTHTHWDSRAIKLPVPVSSQRGILKSIHDVAECIQAYEHRIEELTEMCNEIYEKLKEAQKE